MLRHLQLVPVDFIQGKKEKKNRRQQTKASDGSLN